MPPPNGHSRPGPQACSRRQFLRVAASAPFAVNSLLHGDITAPQARTRLPLIILFLSGGVSAKESFNPDPPGTASELKGPFGTVPTQTPGVHFSEMFPELAQRT